MKFRTVICSAREVLFVGSEGGNAKSADEWLATGRWKISMTAMDRYLSQRLKDRSFGDSIDGFVLCFEIADFELWESFFTASADYVSYRPKRKEIWSVGQIRWSDVKDLAVTEQLRALRRAIQGSIKRIGAKKRRPKNFNYLAFSLEVETLLKEAAEEELAAKPSPRLSYQLPR
jgi:hypothetical protein